MELVFYCSSFTVAILSSIIAWSISIIKKEGLDEKSRIIALAILHSIIYCLLQFSYGFVQWTIRFNKFHQYPHRNPFYIFVSICCIVSVIIMGIFYIKYRKEEYGTAKTVLYLIAINTLAIILVMIFSPFKGWF
ncbi:MAG: hypothetical protein HFJ30_06050 [Clostridia bacterium]|nr:hypothetical protein [Clostridia bacterium]